MKFHAGTSVNVKRLGCRFEIIVGVDGIRVWKLAQSSIQYDRSFDAPLRYTVWRDGSYVDVEGPFRQHYYAVDAGEYPLPTRQRAANAAH